MAEDGALLERRVYINALYDLYSPLLTERQRDVYEMRYFSDLSLAEAAEALGITRQAVHILVNRTAGRLAALEKDLGFAAQVDGLERRIKELEAQLRTGMKLKEDGAEKLKKMEKAKENV